MRPDGFTAQLVEALARDREPFVPQRRRSADGFPQQLVAALGRSRPAEGRAESRAESGSSLSMKDPSVRDPSMKDLSMRNLPTRESLVAAVAGLPPARRLALRGPGYAFVDVLGAGRVLARSRARARELDRTLDRARARAEYLGQGDLSARSAAVQLNSLAAALTGAQYLARGLVLDNDRAIARARDIARAQDLAGARTVDLERAHDLARALHLAVSLDGSLRVALDPPLGTVDRPLARRLVEALDRALDVARDLGAGLGQDLDRARARALDSALALARPLGLDLPGTAAADLVRAFLVAGAESADAIKRMRAALDDFTEADLQHADLAEVPLTGVRWSLGTRWPPSWLEWVEHNSVDLGGGLYRIQPGAGATDDLALLPR